MLIFLSFFLTLNFYASQVKSQNKSNDNLMFFKSFECLVNDEVKEKYVYSNFSCFAKIYSRKVSTLNFYAVFKKPINKLFVSFNKYLNLI